MTRSCRTCDHSHTAGSFYAELVCDKSGTPAQLQHGWERGICARSSVLPAEKERYEQRCLSLARACAHYTPEEVTA
jgi:hypothetical protein